MVLLVSSLVSIEQLTFSFRAFVTELAYSSSEILDGEFVNFSLQRGSTFFQEPFDTFENVRDGAVRVGK